MDVADLEAGIYFYQIYDRKAIIQNGKLVISRK